MFEEIIELIGKEKGSTSIILAGVHGNEVCGVEAYKKVVPNLEIEKGRVLFGYGNPRAIVANLRLTEANLNRMFKDDVYLSAKEKESYEYGRAQFLKKYFEQADVLLDIHASSIPRSKSFVICESNAKDIVQYLPMDLVVSGFGSVEPGGTDYYMNSIGKIGVCIECGYLGDEASVEVAEESIFAFLKVRGHISNDTILHSQSYINMYELYFSKSDSFILAKNFENFENISAGQLIGVDGGTEIRAERDSIILFAHNLKIKGEEAFLLGEKKNSLA